MKKELKDTIVVELGQKLKEYPHFYLVDTTGLNAEQTSNLRRKCFKNEIKMVVVKNTLLHKAFEASDIDFSPLYDSLKGNTAVFFTQTANVPAKLLKEYKKEGIRHPRPEGCLCRRGFLRRCRQTRRAGIYQEQERTYRRRCGSAAVSGQERCFWPECWWQAPRAA